MTWFSRLFRKSKQDAQLDSELRFHVEQQTADNIAAGMNPDEARRSALAQFGGLEYIKEETRDARGVAVIESLLQDIRYGVRMLLKNWKPASIAAFSLAVAMALSVAGLSVFNGIMLRSPVATAPEQLVVCNN
jgi:putative ABC transport system permease protein